MALVKVKPTSPGRRAVVKVVNANLHKGRPHDALIEKKTRKPAATHGHITTRHQGGGHKQHYRMCRFPSQQGWHSRARSKILNTTRIVVPTLPWCLYADGERRYIIATKGMVVGQK
jgi:large subunit ribosomal protein L2